jgi:hypothetical protein
MKYFAVVLTVFVFAGSAQAQYPRPLTLYVTRITRTLKAAPNCDNCVTGITLEAHTATVNFVLVCDANTFPNLPESRRICAQMELGTYEATRISVDSISFWTDPPDKQHPRPAYTIAVDEARAPSNH